MHDCDCYDSKKRKKGKEKKCIYSFHFLIKVRYPREYCKAETSDSSRQGILFSATTDCMVWLCFGWLDRVRVGVEYKYFALVSFVYFI